MGYVYCENCRVSFSDEKVRCPECGRIINRKLHNLQKLEKHINDQKIQAQREFARKKEERKEKENEMGYMFIGLAFFIVVIYLIAISIFDKDNQSPEPLLSTESVVNPDYSYIDSLRITDSQLSIIKEGKTISQDLKKFKSEVMSYVDKTYNTYKFKIVSYHTFDFDNETITIESHEEYGVKYYSFTMISASRTGDVFRIRVLHHPFHP